MLVTQGGFQQKATRTTKGSNLSLAKGNPTTGLRRSHKPKALSTMVTGRKTPLKISISVHSGYASLDPAEIFPRNDALEMDLEWAEVDKQGHDSTLESKHKVGLMGNVLSAEIRGQRKVILSHSPTTARNIPSQGPG